MRRRVLDCAARHFDAGDGDRAIALLEEAREAAPPGLARAAVVARMAYMVAYLVGPGEADDLYRDALVEAEGDAALEAEIHINMADLRRDGGRDAGWHTPNWPSRLHHARATPRSGAVRWRSTGSSISAPGEAFRASG